MARIRSIHPGLFTDEGFVSLSDAAQVFLLGIWTEADDQGVFEWKPTTLRMRLRPTRDGAVDCLLSELLVANFVRKYEIGSRQYGAIRNFRKFQRPKSPNSVHAITDEIRIYVALNNQVSEISIDEPPTFPPKEEIRPQMEEGGDKMDEVKKEEDRPKRVRTPYPDPFRGFWKAYPTTPIMSKKEAFKEWVKLSDDERTSATAAVKPFVGWLGKQKDHPVVHACRFLSQRRFEGFEVEAVDLSNRWQALPQSREWELWRDYYVATGAKFSVKLLDEKADEGKSFVFPQQFPPALMSVEAPAAFDGIPEFLERKAG
jgi:hypothetical protein